MPGVSQLRSLWRNLIHRDRVERELDDELRATFEALVDEHVAAGMDPAAARRAATLALGRIDSIKTQVRESRTGNGLETLRHDITFGARMMRRNPLFTLTAVLSLGLGVGANTTIFSVVNALLLRDLHVPEAHRLVEVGRTTRRGPGFSFSYPAYEMFRDQNSVFSGLVAVSTETLSGHGGAAGREPAGRMVSGNLFDVLQLSPAAGRLLSPLDDRADAPQGSTVAVLAHRFWQREFGGSSNAIGQTIRVDATLFTIVGVLPPTFDDLVVGRPADFFIPIASEALLDHDSQLREAASSWLGIVGRLKPGVSIESAHANLEPILSRFLTDVSADVPDENVRSAIRSQRLFLQSGSRGVSDVRRDFSRPVLLLMGAVALVMLIACANVINLLLARGVTRRQEIAVRLAVGASRGRLVRQLLTESALLGGAGAALGLAIAAVTAPLLLQLVPQRTSPLVLDVSPDWRVLSFTVSTAIVSSLVAGIVPAVRGSRADLTESFAGNVRSLHVSRDSTRWGQWLIAAQVALSLLLVVGAALLVTTVRNMRGVDPGFEAQHVLLLKLDPGRIGYSGDRLTQYYRDVLDRVRAIPGVQSASVSRVTPISGGGIDQPITVEGRAREPGAMILANRTSDGFFATMAIPMLLGRDLTSADSAQAPGVVINEALMRRYFPNENPIGRRIVLGDRRPREIVGVVANSKYFSVRDGDMPTAYLYMLHLGESGGLTLSVRTAGDPSSFAATIRASVASVAATVPLSQGRTLSSQVDRSFGTERLVARLLGAFAGIALVLAAVGLYGVLGYNVVRRTGEIGLRLALGASRRAILGSVLRQSMIVVLLGSAVGIPAAMMLSRPLSGLLYGVTPSDPAVLAGAVGCLFLVALAAAALPAWRAASVDPLTALRHQ